MVFLWFSRSFQLSTWFKAAESPDVPPRVRARPGWRPTCHSNPLRHLRRCGPMWIIIMFSEWIVYFNIYICMYVCMYAWMYVCIVYVYIYIFKEEPFCILFDGQKFLPNFPYIPCQIQLPLALIFPTPIYKIQRKLSTTYYILLCLILYINLHIYGIQTVLRSFKMQELKETSTTCFNNFMYAYVQVVFCFTKASN